jgi:hypothetical protein
VLARWGERPYGACGGAEDIATASGSSRRRRTHFPGYQAVYPVVTRSVVFRTRSSGQDSPRPFGQGSPHCQRQESSPWPRSWPAGGSEAATPYVPTCKRDT